MPNLIRPIYDPSGSQAAEQDLERRQQRMERAPLRYDVEIDVEVTPPEVEPPPKKKKPPPIPEDDPKPSGVLVAVWESGVGTSRIVKITRNGSCRGYSPIGLEANAGLLTYPSFEKVGTAHWIVARRPGTSIGTLYRSRNKGRDWTVSLANVMNGANSGVPARGKGGPYWTLQFDPALETLTVLKSEDGGDTWIAGGLVIDTSAAGYNVEDIIGIAVNPTDADLIAVVTAGLSAGPQRAHVFYTTNGGSSWADGDASAQLTRNGAPAGRNIAFMEDGRMVIVTAADSASANDKLIAIYSDTPAAYTDVNLSAVNADWGFETVNGGLQASGENLICTFNSDVAASKFFASITRGATWYEILPPENMQFTNAHYEPSFDTLYTMGVDGQFWRLEEPFSGGTTWVDMTADFVDAADIPQVDLSPWYGIAITSL